MSSSNEKASCVVDQLIHGVLRYGTHDYSHKIDDLIYLLEKVDAPEIYLEKLLNSNQFKFDCLRAVAYMINESVNINICPLLTAIRRIVISGDDKSIIMVAEKFSSLIDNKNDALLYGKMLDFQRNIYVRLRYFSLLKKIDDDVLRFILDGKLNLIEYEFLFNGIQIEDYCSYIINIINSDASVDYKIINIIAYEKFSYIDNEQVYNILGETNDPVIFEYFYSYSCWRSFLNQDV